MKISAILSYLLKAQNEHGLHSPFVYDLYLDTIRKNEFKPEFEIIELVRQQMLNSQQQITITDYGAGSKINQSNIRRVSDIAQHSKKSARLGQLFQRLIQRFHYEYIFDLGTSLGLTTLYLHTASFDNKVFTFEGCPATAAIAQQNFEKVRKQIASTSIQTNKDILQNPILVVGNLDQTLDKVVGEVPRIDFAFFDANHRYEPTIRYFETCLKKAHNDSLFVFDDIHWSDEMEQAWEVIKKHPAVTVTIDLLSIGLVFFRKEQRKQDFVLRWPFWK